MEDGASTRPHHDYGLQTTLIRFFRHRYHLLGGLGAPDCGTVPELGEIRDVPRVR